MYTCTNSFEIKNGKIINVQGNLCKILSPYSAKIDDWDCVMDKKKLTCTCTRTLKDEQTYLSYVIFKSGYSKLVLKLANNKTQVLSRKWLSIPFKFTFTGIVTLSDGDICKRYASFKSTHKS